MARLFELSSHFTNKRLIQFFEMASKSLVVAIGEALKYCSHLKPT